MSWSGKFCKNIYSVKSQKRPGLFLQHCQLENIVIIWNTYVSCHPPGICILQKIKHYQNHCCYKKVLTPLRSLFEVSGWALMGNITHSCKYFKVHFLHLQQKFTKRVLLLLDCFVVFSTEVCVTCLMWCMKPTLSFSNMDMKKKKRNFLCRHNAILCHYRNQCRFSENFIVILEVHNFSKS